jgi:serine/threonine protein kinase
MTKYSPPELEKNKVYINSDFYSLGVVINTLFEKEFEFGPPDKIKLTQKIKSGKEGIDTVLDLGLLKELADKMVRKNYVERSDFYEILRTRQCSSTISEKKSEIRG